ncbi:MAG: Rrf2 family transcriptional regulator [Candidatus Bipolaricaulota bacterium]|nr:MAG: Rrf2 family transcriptional regulator [Candidatus Bipolaricaulota bacterium]
MAELLKMSEGTALGLHAMAVAAGNEAAISAAVLAEELEASKDHLSKVLKNLTDAGFLHSKRGPSGGYALARPAEEITLLDLYEALEGPLRRDGCLFSDPVCRGGDCILGGTVAKVRKELLEYLSSTPLDEVATSRRRT